MLMSRRPSQEERQERASMDSRNKETLVMTTPTGAANTGYAYHIPNEEGEPRCGAGGDNTEFIKITIEEAQRRNKSPCQFCERIS